MVQLPVQRLKEVASIALQKTLALKSGEEILIISNPDEDVKVIAEALFAASLEIGGKPTLIFQPAKSGMDYAERTVLSAIESAPDVILSISAMKLGKDPYGLHVGYVGRDGKKYSSIFDKVKDGDRRARGFWTPGITVDMFLRTVDIDYDLMRRQVDRLCNILNPAELVRITSPAGTDIVVSVRGRQALKDDGDFTQPGSGGNIPCGEAFISPALGGVDGIAVFDGTIALGEKPDIVPGRPIRVEIRGGFVVKVEEDSLEASRLLLAIKDGEKRATTIDKPEMARNAWHIGELGFGFNPAAKMTGNLLEDEKLLNSVHLAIGANYDHDADALIHFDCLILSPTIYVDGEKISYY
ncbi:MAG: aminopeptidase [Dehalococcoidia bacterium]|nr:aminopeptidase [Dehalococcoidia bacterium]